MLHFLKLLLSTSLLILFFPQQNSGFSNSNCIRPSSHNGIEAQTSKLKSFVMVATSESLTHPGISKRITSEDTASYTETGRILEQIGNAPLLTVEEEGILGRQIQELISYEIKFDSLKSELDRDPTMEEWAYALQLKEIELSERLEVCREAKQSMVSANMRLVISIAKKYRHLGVNFADLIQEGSMGLMRATEKFDPSRGYKFSTYAAWWIQQSVMKSVANHSRIIRLPVHVHNLLYNVRKIKRQSLADTGEIITPEEIADRLAIPYERLQKYLDASRSTISTERPETTAPSSVKEVRLNKSFNSPEETTERLLLRKRLLEVLDDLPSDQRLILGLRYGLYEDPPKTVPQVAKSIGWPVERVRNCEIKALRKLRNPHNQLKMSQFVEFMKGPEQKDLVL